jgi:hyperosmotically inducible protein
MRGIKQAVLVIITGGLLLLTGCNNSTETANANVNANANLNANRPVTVTTPVAGTDANANANGRASAPTREDYERNKEKYDREAKQSGRKVGSGTSDGWLWVKARYDLAAVDDLRDSTINVDVENGVVTLTGTVPTAAQRTKAEQTAKSVAGVTSVKNMLKVTPANSNANTKPSPPRK